jgi:Type III restriction enzyme, res subunit
VSKDYLHLKTWLSQAIDSDGGLAVYRHYGFEPSRKPQKINPFRQERTSSFFITQKNGHYFFKDFGDDNIKGDCWKFVQLYENAAFPQVFEILCQIYNIVDFGQETSAAPILPKQPLKKESSVFEKKLLEIQFKPFSKAELAYWQQKGGIDLKTLESNQVLSVASFRIQISESNIKEYQNLQYIFAYEIVPKQAYKLYMPKEEHRVYAGSKTVFLPNLEPARKLYGEDYSYTFGLGTLKNEPFILCAGEPDCLALKSLGYNAFTLGDERASIPDYVWENISKKLQNNGAKALLQGILYDTDYTGLQSAKKLGLQYQKPALVLPKLSKQFEKNQAKPIFNDVCDYLSKYGYDADLQLTLRQSTFQNKDYRLSHIPTFSVEKYLNEQTPLLAQFIKKHQRVQIDADAGIGKTYTMLVELPALLQKPILFAVPFAIQVEQIEQEYQGKVPDLMCFTNQSTQGLTEDDIFMMQNRPVGKINVCTIDRIKPVFERLKLEYGQDIIVVIDESHLLTSEFAYRSRAIQETLEVCQSVEKTVYLSATPDYSLCKFSGFKLIRFKRQRNPTIRIEAIDYKGEAKKNLLKCLTQSSNSSNEETKQDSGITIIRLNNKTLAKVIADVLIAQKLYESNEIDFVFSEKRKGLSTPAKENIVKNSLIPSNVKLLFVTACFDCGINILNTNIKRIISFETQYTDNCLDTFKQLIARFRNLEEVNVTVCKPVRYLEYESLKPKGQLYERLSRDARNKLALLPFHDQDYQSKIQQQILDIQQYGTQSHKTPSYLKSNGDISAIHRLIQWDRKSNQYKVNYNHIRFTLKEYERKGLNSKDFFQYLVDDLPNTSLESRCMMDAQSKSEQCESLKNLLAYEKDAQKFRIALVCEAMRQSPTQFFDAVHAEYRDVGLKDKIKRHFAITSTKEAPKLVSILKATYESSSKAEATPLNWDNFQSNLFDEEILTLSNRYFYLLDVLIPKHKIPDLLEEYAGDSSFGTLCKTLTNHIYLFAKQIGGKDWKELIADKRKLEDIQTLELWIDAIQKWKPKVYAQKNAAKWLNKLNEVKSELKDLSALQTSRIQAVEELEVKMKTGAKLKSELRDLRRKLDSINHKIVLKKSLLDSIQLKFQESTITGWEINTLSDKLNKLRVHTSDWQGLRVNMRLMNSLFDVKVQKRAVLISGKSEESIYVEKQIAEIGHQLSFTEILQRYGFTEEDSDEYLSYLKYQIRLDLQSNRAKNSQKSLDSAKEITQAISSWSDLAMNLSSGYPAEWDV